jgi:hypothetical protein
MVAFNIEPTGNVDARSVSISGRAPQSLKECLASVIRAIRFPAIFDQLPAGQWQMSVNSIYH